MRLSVLTPDAEDTNPDERLPSAIHSNYDHTDSSRRHYAARPPMGYAARHSWTTTTTRTRDRAGDEDWPPATAEEESAREHAHGESAEANAACAGRGGWNGVVIGTRSADDDARREQKRGQGHGQGESNTARREDDGGRQEGEGMSGKPHSHAAAPTPTRATKSAADAARRSTTALASRHACDVCGRWCHAACFGSDEASVLEEWRCWVCAPGDLVGVVLTPTCFSVVLLGGQLTFARTKYLACRFAAAPFSSGVGGIGDAGTSASLVLPLFYVGVVTPMRRACCLPSLTRGLLLPLLTAFSVRSSPSTPFILYPFSSRGPFAGRPHLLIPPPAARRGIWRPVYSLLGDVGDVIHDTSAFVNVAPLGVRATRYYILLPARTSLLDVASPRTGAMSTLPPREPPSPSNPDILVVLARADSLLDIVGPQPE
ncbi:hypothetical protein B0H16DRAFT_1465698 [Mycena metata]|uniref:Zinc finger PHD-type domain-containing protein n=1 Tax=Mycena metata TaxID=1033252 RepID=A0AAD7ICB9_9AGAR|nr:hypothetical protein B0H16DRAFT_1465698 [Mycena metata]